MHDVLDPRDLVPDEVEQMSHTGYDVGALADEAREAAQANDLARLAQIDAALTKLPRSPGWSFHEPDDDATLLGQAAAAPILEVDADELPGRIRGAWLGRAVANTMGKPIEGLSRTEVKTYLQAADHWPQTGYVPLVDPLPAGVSALHPSAPVASAGRFEDIPRDDDIDWTILTLHLLERHGRELTTEQIAVEWLDRVPFTQTYTAERAAYRNLIEGLRPPETATTRNPYREWIGALIRGDAYGYVSPGDPGEAARLALVDARLSHTANGVYGEMWAAGLVAAALGAGSAGEALTASLAVIPAQSRLARAIGGVIDLHAWGATHEDALDWVDDELGYLPWVHTVNNAALIVTGLLWGRSFTDAVAITISGGRDTDSSGATVGSVYGALHGASSVPAALVEPTHHLVRSAVRDYDRIGIAELAERTLRLARAHVPDRERRT